MRSVIPRTPFLLLLFIFCCALHFLLTRSLPLSRNLSLSQTISSPTLTDKLEQWLRPSFAQSNLRIYVYDIPSEYNADLVKRSIERPGLIRDPRCDTNFYSSEYHFHHFLLNSPVRTHDPEQAHFFYVPIYTTCDLMKQPKEFDRVASNFQNAMHWVTTRFQYWNRSEGRDHVYLFAQGNSARLAGDWQKFSNGIFMVHNGEFTAPEYTPHKDFTIPPELRHYLQPYWRDIQGTKKDPPKKYLAHFGGQVVKQSVSDHRGRNYSGGVRQFISAKFSKHPDYRITGIRSSKYLDDMMASRFCLAPEGWHPWSPRPYYGVLMGCIPVIISEVQELAFEDLIDWDSFVVWVRPPDVRNLDSILRSFSEAEIKRRRNAMKEVWRLMWYTENGLANQAILQELYTRRYASPPKRHFSTIRDSA
ncbi:putative glucuronosyltransferase [Gracilariopsis chorda]|uniref:Putative glucuronosyltransferase n=1 Tax=Gracilariopsis chorda TaxID=448386 RepID=A0A2V3IH96_9FLOR|nr:putative glucuronosyltransferase [Gracilariopsis chorda]|eukprot:PXF41432.1 putative glucuronosyltransferase [Gracilariopsis chorda]